MVEKKSLFALPKVVQQKFELKLSPPLKSVVTLPCKMYKWSSIQLYIHISENSTLYVRRYLFYEFYFLFIFSS